MYIFINMQIYSEILKDTPLSILYLVLVPFGGSLTRSIQNSLDLVQHAEQ